MCAFAADVHLNFKSMIIALKPKGGCPLKRVHWKETTLP